MSFAVVALSSLLLAAEPDAGAEQVDAGAPAGVEMRSPVVKLSGGSGVVISQELLITTPKVLSATARPEGRLPDGGTVELGQTDEDPDRDLALIAISRGAQTAVLSPTAPDAGARLFVLTGTETYEAVVVAVEGSRIELTVADAGMVAGAALVDERGVVYGMLRDDKQAVSAEVLASVLNVVEAPRERQSSSRWRNLGISAAFFLGLSVWWVYRSKRRY